MAACFAAASCLAVRDSKGSRRATFCSDSAGAGAEALGAGFFAGALEADFAAGFAEVLAGGGAVWADAAIVAPRANPSSSVIF